MFPMFLRLRRTHLRVPHRIAAVGAALALLAGATSAPVHAADPPPPPRLAAPELVDHPLVGRIWRRADGAFITPTELARALAAARYVALGETHDNPDHHRIQAWAVAALFAAGRRPGLALEMIRADQQDALSTYLERRPGDVAGIGPALGWKRSGWPAWSLYAPIAAPFVREGLPIVGTNLSRATVKAILRDGFAAVPPDRRTALGLDREPDDALLTDMAREIADAHCGQIAAERALPFARVQFARDAALAEGTVAAARATTQWVSVLVAGVGHVRTDRGVPWHLARMGRRGTVVALAPIEVEAGLTRPADYAARFGTDELPSDYVWFTGREPRGDPCEAFRKNAKNNE